MLGKIPLVKDVHVIFTKLHDCVLHIRAPRSLQCPRTTTGTPASPSVALNFDFHGYFQFLFIGLIRKFALQYATEKLSDGHLVLVS